MRQRIVESRAAQSPAVGSLSMKTGEPRGYVLTFRCINCGKHEVFANYPTEHITPEDRIRDRIYQVTCNSCGWRGDVCGVVRKNSADLEFISVTMLQSLVVSY